MKDATNLSKSHKPIGPHKSEDGSLAVCDVEKANVMIGTKVAALICGKGQHDKNSATSAWKNLEFAI